MSKDIIDPFAEIDEETQALAVVGAGVIESLSDSQEILFNSLPNATRRDQLATYNLIAGESASLMDHLKEPIQVRDLVIHKMDQIDAETGERSEMIRIILVDAEGCSYSAVSIGVLNCLKKMIKLVGPPTWDPPIELTPRTVRTAAGRTLLLLSATGDE